MLHARNAKTANRIEPRQVVQGLLLASPRALASRDQLVRLWLHESCRVFHDRLTCDGDKTAFKNMLVGWFGVLGDGPGVLWMMGVISSDRRVCCSLADLA
jgi:dynein heavy chain